MKATRLPIFFAAIVLAELALSFYWQALVPRTEDVAYHLNGAERMLHGAALYRDILVPNLPMFFLMRIPGVWLAELIGTAPINVAIVFDNVMALLALGLTLVLLKKTPLGSPAALGVMTIVIVFILFLFPYFTTSLGQQEYFFLLTSLPYFTLAAARAEGVFFSRRLRIAIGALAAIGISYKPMFLLPWLLIELGLMVYARSWRSVIRAENITIVAIGMVYTLWTLTLPGFFATLLPMLDYYYQWRFPLERVMRYFINQLLPFLLPLAILGGYAVWRKIPLRRFLCIYGLALLGCILAAMSQLKIGKGFGYHLYPAFAMAVLLAGACAVALAAKKEAPSYRAVALFPRFALAGIVLYCLIQTFAGAHGAGKGSERRTAKLEHIIGHQKEYASGELRGMYVFGASLLPIFPEGIFNRNISWDYHFYDLWLLESLRFSKRDNAINAHTEAMENFLRETVTADLERNMPELILVMHRRSDYYLSYFNQHPKFAELMKHYKLLEEYKGFDIYVRKP